MFEEVPRTLPASVPRGYPGRVHARAGGRRPALHSFALRWPDVRPLDVPGVPRRMGDGSVIVGGRRLGAWVAKLLAAHALSYPAAFAWAVATIPLAIRLSATELSIIDTHAAA